MVSGAFWRLSTTETTPQPEMTTLTKTIASFHYPAPTPRNPFGTKLYRVYLEVTVPKSIANTAQAALDRCMEVAKAAAYYVILPFLTPATMSGLPAAIPGALAAAIKAFGVCVASEPRLYPHANRIKVDIKSNRDA
ncbi:hypothetical protein EX87_14470 [Brevibacillus laterosporus]|uniref:Uncharacterized protein n=1 Tax=Brevibacillus laterosporus TaxID=1465 RepID=A0A0F7C0V7_BRELA|nr:hypothetical protein EX87_14470 [Brevibacillus laterosporus]